MTRFGIHRLVTRYAEMASEKVPSMLAKRISPHNIRHTTAVHMLRGGVDINTIRAWLGHVSLETTNIYAEVDLEMKAKALAGLDIALLRKRVVVYEAAKARHPQRWSGATRNWQPVRVVHLNPEKPATEAVMKQEKNPELKKAA